LIPSDGSVPGGRSDDGSDRDVRERHEASTRLEVLRVFHIARSLVVRVATSHEAGCATRKPPQMLLAARCGSTQTFIAFDASCDRLRMTTRL
jgi:hypothetical protein